MTTRTAEHGTERGTGERRAAGPWLLGVRHHGPGSARAVGAALAQYEPKALLIEGPPEADALVALAADEEMRPPVALLAHVADDPGRAAFWPMAEFSPEWVALRWALRRGVPVRFIDLPAAHSLAGSGSGSGPEEPSLAGPEAEAEAEAEAGEGTAPDGPAEPAGPVAGDARVDPLGVLAEAAGYDDAERWWEDVVEHRGTAASGDALAPFEALAEAMGALREEGEAGEEGGASRDAVREAHMRLRLREARREFGDDIAVVCGAWHVPALARRTTVTADRALLKGLPKAKVSVTWVPWTHRRLSRSSGYGAGIASPGWYGHLFSSPDRPIERWLTKVAGLLRGEDYAVSTAHVIEAVRLAESLAAMRGRPLAGLTETEDAVRAVLSDGSDVPASLIHDRLVVGDVLGEVPRAAPAVPLQRDIARLQRTLRLKPEAKERELELDLRKETDAARSRLLHRLRLLDIPWGAPTHSRTSTGTFRETWRLRWEPELSVRVAEAGIWGTTVLAAATARAASDAADAGALAEVTALAERCLLAELPDALPVVMRVLADRAALDADVGHLAQALPALVRSVRYGDVRGTDAAALREVAVGLVERVFVGLPPACASLDAEGAAEMRTHLDATQQAVGLLSQVTEDGGLRGRWTAVLRVLAEREAIPGLIRGRAARMLVDDGRLEDGGTGGTGGTSSAGEGDGTRGDGGAARLMGLALSPGVPPADAAAWIEGFVGGGAGGGMLLVHDERLLALLDGWLTRVPGEAFTDVLPLLRRTFSQYEPGVRRTLGELVRRGPVAAGAVGGGAAVGHGAAGGGEEAAAPGFGPGLDRDRAAAVLPTLHALLGEGPDGRDRALTTTGTDTPSGERR
ncbi:DUF5682 family protein [Streptomyces ochraceiscleroticus]|uniref:DUF5682 family protein n=1 Tax=Streptomyces ochraceiscleroticus TaxID=47761 RepID=A0ABW1MG96_9ACTN|nr:DUF5682 family protein [Streptomyces ochraceiscleroticus]